MRDCCPSVRQQRFERTGEGKRQCGTGSGGRWGLTALWVGAGTASGIPWTSAAAAASGVAVREEVVSQRKNLQYWQVSKETENIEKHKCYSHRVVVAEFLVFCRRAPAVVAVVTLLHFILGTVVTRDTLTPDCTPDIHIRYRLSCTWGRGSWMELFSVFSLVRI